MANSFGVLTAGDFDNPRASMKSESIWELERQGKKWAEDSSFAYFAIRIRVYDSESDFHEHVTPYRTLIYKDGKGWLTDKEYYRNQEKEADTGAYIYMLYGPSDLGEGKGRRTLMAVHTDKDYIKSLVKDLPTNEYTGCTIDVKLEQYPLTEEFNNHVKNSLASCYPLKTWFYRGRTGKWFDDYDRYVREF